MNWREVKDEIEKENESILLTPPEEVIKIFKFNIIESGAGSYGQAFTAMVFTEGDCRYLAFYGANNIVALCDDEAVNLDALKAMARMFMPLSAEFLGYCGLKKVWIFVQHLMDALDTVQTKEEMKELVTAITLYCGTLNSWIQHYFPWNVGTFFPQRQGEDIREMARLASV
jgi:Cucumopine synthase C-terminal helical bundle domain